jgi:hypothetical protein
LSSEEPFGGLIGGALIFWVGTRLIIRAGNSNIESLTEASKTGITDISNRQSITFIAIGFIAMVVFGLAPILIEFNIRTDDNFHYMFWMFAVIGFFFYRYGRGKVRDYNEIGQLILFLNDSRGVIGGEMSGSCNIKGIPTTEKITLCLVSKEIYKTRNNDEIKLNEVIRFRKVIEPSIDSDLTGNSVLHFAIQIPENCSPSFAKGSLGKIHWYVELAGEFTALSGRTVLLNRVWKVPVSVKGSI